MINKSLFIVWFVAMGIVDFKFFRMALKSKIRIASLSIFIFILGVLILAGKIFYELEIMK